MQVVRVIYSTKWKGELFVFGVGVLDFNGIGKDSAQ